MDDQVGEIATNENFTRQKTSQFINKHAAIRTTNQKILRQLLRSKFFEKIGIPCRNSYSPFAVLLKYML